MRGRPTGYRAADPRNNPVTVRYTSGELAVIKRAAELRGVTTARFTQEAAVAEARRVVGVSGGD